MRTSPGQYSEPEKSIPNTTYVIVLSETLTKKAQP